MSFLWAVPVVWLLLIPLAYWWVDGRFPQFPTEWPLGINKSDDQAITDQISSLASLWLSLTRTRVVFFAGALLTLALVIRALAREPTANGLSSDRFARAFQPFSLLSLAVIYLLVVVFDPFQATPGNSRMSLPLLVHGFIWAVILLAEASRRGAAVRAVAFLLILAGLSPSVNLGDWSWKTADYTKTWQTYAEIEADLDTAVPDRRGLVCIFDPDYFNGLERLLTPTLYRNRSMVLQSKPIPLDRCKAILATAGHEPEPGLGFEERRTYTVAGQEYALLLPRRSTGGDVQ